MNEKLLHSASWLVLLLLIGIGIWMLVSGRGDFGLGLMAGAAGVFISKFIKQNRIKALQAKGIPPYDERTYAIVYRASYITLVTLILLVAFFVLVGYISAPQWRVNPYNFAGIGLAAIVMIYLFYYQYYTRKM
ncbi:MAG TPA: DUF2178 domain-containing protein [Syntrophomonadaceae bacterium]|nr:DUF2178 domain-containing protein [Syntrophomonadaceae bacterium]